MIFPSKPDRAFFMALMFSTWHNSFWYTFSITAVLCGTALVPEGHANYWRTTGHSTRGSLQLQLQLGVERSVVRAPSRILRFSLPPFPYVLGHRSLFFFSLLSFNNNHMQAQTPRFSQGGFQLECKEIESRLIYQRSYVESFGATDRYKKPVQAFERALSHSARLLIRS